MAQRRKGEFGGEKEIGHKWRLREKIDEDVSFNLKRIAETDRMGFAKEGFSGTGLTYKYAIHTSESIVKILEKECSGSKIKSTQISGDDIAVNGLRTSGIEVSVIYVRGEKPELFVRISGKNDLENRKIKREITKLSERLS